LLLDDGLLGDAASVTDLPPGFDGFLSRMELPPSMAHLAARLPDANYGLAARWHAALSEWESLLTIPSHLRAAVATALLDQLYAGLAETPGVDVPDEPAAPRSIVTLRIGDGRGGFLARESLTRIYADMVRQPGVQVGQPVDLVPNRMAALRFAVGAPTVTRLLTADRPIAAARAMATDAVDRLSERLREPVTA
jgi:hypothetical protein